MAMQLKTQRVQKDVRHPLKAMKIEIISQVMSVAGKVPDKMSIIAVVEAMVTVLSVQIGEFNAHCYFLRMTK